MIIKILSKYIHRNFLLTLAILPLLNSCIWQSKEKQTSAIAQPSTIKASVSNISRPVSEKYACFNVNSLLVKSWSDPEFWQAIVKVDPKLLRVPGGTESNYWDWQKGGLIENVREEMAGYPINFRETDLKYDRSKLEDIQVGINETKTTPIFVLNMASSSLESQLEMLRVAQDLGMPIEYVELGNEFYFSLPNYERVFPTPDDYAQTAREWIDAIKQEFPSAEISLVGVAASSKDSRREQNWHQSLLDTTMEQADAVTLHIYNGHGLESSVEDDADYPFFNSEEVPIILGQPFRKWQGLQKNERFGLIPDNKEIWITEYNLFEQIFDKQNEDAKQRVMGSWAHGLYTLTSSLLFLEDSRIAIACNHVLTGNSRFAAIFDREKSFINPSDENVRVQPMTLSATGWTLSFLGQASSGMKQAQKIDFSGVPTLVGKKDFEYPALYGWMFENNTDSQAVIVNLSDKELKVDLEQLFANPTQYEQIAENPQTLVTGNEIVKMQNGTASNEIVLPAYSATRLETK